MAGTIGVVAAIASIGSSVFGGFGQEGSYRDQAEAQERAAAQQRNAAYKAEVLANRNARNIEAETYETARREGNALEQELGKSRALAAASGLAQDDEDSQELTILANESEGKREIDWLESAGLNQAKLTRWEGKQARKAGISAAQFSTDMASIARDQGSTAKWSGIVNSIAGTSSVYSAGSNAGWWGS